MNIDRDLKPHNALTSAEVCRPFFDERAIRASESRSGPYRCAATMAPDLDCQGNAGHPGLHCWRPRGES
jgi:hypothetical protein